MVVQRYGNDFHLNRFLSNLNHFSRISLLSINFSHNFETTFVCFYRFQHDNEIRRTSFLKSSPKPPKPVPT